MTKKPTSSRITKLTSRIQSTDRSWHNGGDIEILLYARSLQRAARALVEGLDLEPNPKTAWDACPIVLLYREAIELHMKLLVGEGSNFLPSPTDPITLYQTHSLRWLAQIVGQIIRAMKWESEFKCEGVANLSDFSALVKEVEALDPVSCAVHSHHRGSPGDVPPSLKKDEMLEVVPKLDALLDLLAATTDGLAATWDLQEEGADEETFYDGGDIEPTIQ